MSGCRYQPDHESGRGMTAPIVSNPGGKLGVCCCVSVVLAFVVLFAGGCDTTSASSSFDGQPPEIAATQTTVSATINPSPVTRTAVPKIAVSPSKKPSVTVPKKPPITVLAPPPATNLNHSAPVQGANPTAWIGTFCAGIGEENATSIPSPQSPLTAQDTRNELLQFLGTLQQGFTTTANKLTQLGPPAVTGGKQAQDIAVGFFTTMASIYSDHRAKLAALDENDPDLEQKVTQLMPGAADFNETSTQLNEVTNNQELGIAFINAPECRQLVSAPTPP